MSCASSKEPVSDIMCSSPVKFRLQAFRRFLSPQFVCGTDDTPWQLRIARLLWLQRSAWTRDCLPLCGLITGIWLKVLTTAQRCRCSQSDSRMKSGTQQEPWVAFPPLQWQLLRCLQCWNGNMPFSECYSYRNAPPACSAWQTGHILLPSLGLRLC